MKWIRELLKEWGIIRDTPPSVRDHLRVKQIAEILNEKGRGPLYPSSSPLPVARLRKLLIKCAKHENPDSPQRAEICRLFVETARFQPLYEESDLQMQRLFGPNPSEDILEGLRSSGGKSARAEAMVVSDRVKLKAQLRRHGL